MLKKLLQYIRSLFSPAQFDSPAAISSDLFLESVNPPPIPVTVEYVTLNLDTGKITLPDHLSAEDKKELEEALQEFNASLQKFAPEELYKSMEDFLKSAGEMKVSAKPEVFPLWEGITPVNKDDNSLSKVKEEMEFCDENTEHWKDIDFAEALHEFEAQGYDFDGVEHIYSKINTQVELNEKEKRQLREWYKLATQEFVYGV